MRNAEVYILKTRCTCNCVLFVISVVPNFLFFFFYNFHNHRNLISYMNTIFVDPLQFKTKKILKQSFSFWKVWWWLLLSLPINESVLQKQRTESVQQFKTEYLYPRLFSSQLPHIHQDGSTPLYSHYVSRGSDVETAATPIARDQCIKGTMVASDSKKQDKNKTMPTGTYRICIFQYIVLRCSVG